MCPICNAKLQVKYHDTLDGHTLMEELIVCPNGHYSDFYAYGHTEITICGYTFESHWNDSDEQQRQFDENVDSCIVLLAQLVRASL